MMSALTVHCRWQGDSAREMVGNRALYADVKKMKSITVLHTLSQCLRDSYSSCSDIARKNVGGGLGFGGDSLDLCTSFMHYSFS